MKYVIFSFDDGGLDCYDVAFPILEKYSLKAVFNVITGCIDKTIKINHPYVSYDMCRIMESKGHEIALHSDKHAKHTDKNDIEICYKKLLKELGKKEYSIAMPFNQIPDDSVVNFASKCSINSISVGRYRRHRRNIKEYLLYFIAPFSSRYFYAFKNIVYIQKKSEFKNMSKPVIMNRIGAYSNVTPKQILTLIKFAPKDSVIVIMFHSIILNEQVRAPWPEGAWTVKKFDELCKKIAKNNKICNLTMRSLFKIIGE